MYLIALDYICKTKKEGILGFQKNKINNFAMLSRSVWRLVENPDYLLATVLNAKYFEYVDELKCKSPGTAYWVYMEMPPPNPEQDKTLHCLGGWRRKLYRPME